MPSRICDCGEMVATWGNPDGTARDALWCANCPSKPATAIIVKPKSQVCECGKGRPVMGHRDQALRKAQWCKQCPNRPPDTIDLRNRRCLCGRVAPSFGMPGDLPREAKWCLLCPTRPEGSINVAAKKCECGRAQPNFSLPGEGFAGAKWCARCPNKPAEAHNPRQGRRRLVERAQPILSRRSRSAAQEAAVQRAAAQAAAARGEGVLARGTNGSGGGGSGAGALEGDVRAEASSPSAQAAGRASEAGGGGDAAGASPFKLHGDSQDNKCECGLTKPVYSLPGDGRDRWCALCPNRPIIAVNVGGNYKRQQGPPLADGGAEAAAPEGAAWDGQRPLGQPGLTLSLASAAHGADAIAPTRTVRMGEWLEQAAALERPRGPAAPGAMSSPEGVTPTAGGSVPTISLSGTTVTSSGGDHQTDDGLAAGDDFIGREVRKRFYNEDGLPAWYTGSVVERRERAGVALFLVRYEDGDAEELSLQELLAIVLPPVKRAKKKAVGTSVPLVGSERLGGTGLLASLRTF